VEITDEDGGHGLSDKETEMGPDSTGWTPRFGWPDDLVEGDSMQDHTTWLESNLADKFYGGESFAASYQSLRSRLTVTKTGTTMPGSSFSPASLRGSLAFSVGASPGFS